VACKVGEGLLESGNKASRGFITDWAARYNAGTLDDNRARGDKLCGGARGVIRFRGLLALALSLKARGHSLTSTHCGELCSLAILELVW
jgi:hypothetical protein